MKDNISLKPTTCAICGAVDNSTEIYPANFSIDDFNPDVFSARRIPDRIHYRIVKCKSCGLVRSDPIIDQETLAELYTKSSQTYENEVSNLINSYSRCLARLDKFHDHKGVLLEIGCGSGFFLERALDNGYQRVMGIEPSQQAVSKSSDRIRSNLICDMMRPGILESNQLDVICMFQVFDHIADPDVLLSECFKALKSGGLLLCLNHNVGAVSARLLGEKSPIIDIEHTYLYTKDTIQKILRKNGFQIKEVGSASNIISTSYLCQLFPFPNKFKKSLISFLQNRSIGSINLSVRLGNLYAIAQKP
jgi:SAM-dependent methyltransferase